MVLLFLIQFLLAPNKAYADYWPAVQIWSVTPLSNYPGLTSDFHVSYDKLYSYPTTKAEACRYWFDRRTSANDYPPFNYIGDDGNFCRYTNIYGVQQVTYRSKLLCSFDASALSSNQCYYPVDCVAPNVRQPNGRCTQQKDNGQPICGMGTNNPIHLARGNKYLLEFDYLSAQSDASFERFYNSRNIFDVNKTGVAWSHKYASRIQASPIISSNLVSISRPDGKTYVFRKVAANWISESDVIDSLAEIKDVNGVRTNWRFTLADNTIETFSASGQLMSITSPSGLMTVLNYNTNGGLQSVTEPLGKSISFGYDYNFSSRIKTTTNPEGGVYSYTYDTNNNLSSVTYPDGKTKTYIYGSTTGELVNVSATPNAGITFTNALTGIIDENGNRYATYRYDAAGRAYDEEVAPDLGASLGQSIEHNNLAYTSDSSGNPISTVVTDPRGSSRTYNFTTILGVVKSTGQSQPAGSGCASAASALTYDVNGNVASRTDFNGKKTTYIYDMARNLETSRTEGLTAAGVATASTRTITTTWHTIWRLPLVISEYSGASSTGTALRTTTNAYDDKGNITSITEADPARTLTRTTTITYTYSSLLTGSVISKVVNGPRTDINDVTNYTYYPHDAVCEASSATPIIDPVSLTSPDNFGCRGQLQSVTNALGQITTYNRYNHHGQVEQMTDANGMVTTNTYDLRQRLLSHTVGALTTSLVYDDAGQVIQLIMPDASTLNYTYDAAHRLIELQDTLGNKVTYTLDAEGNHINEVTTDPLGNLAKTITRSYDPLNRLQQVTGVE